MHLQSFRIVNFRNLRPAVVHFDPGFNLIVGANAQGKTNFLEAVVSLSDGRSFRGARLMEMIERESKEAVVEGQLERREREEELRILFNRNIRRYFLNGKAVTDLKHYLGRINFVVFSAETLRITDGEPRHRRDLLDRCVFSLNPRYLIDLREYDRILKSRNVILKSGNPSRDLLDIYSRQLADFGARIICARVTYLRELATRCISIYKEISGSDETLTLEYRSSVISASEPEDGEFERVRTRIAERMGRERDRDLHRGFTSTGPHRDDLVIRLAGNEIRQYGSRGQKRTAVIAIKLAELDIYRTRRGEDPILILDDIIAELDEYRRNALFSMVPKGVQTFVSHTGVIPFFNPERTRYFQLNNGKIRQGIDPALTDGYFM